MLSLYRMSCRSCMIAVTTTLAGVVLTLCTAATQSQPEQATGVLISQQAIAVNPSNRKVYVVDESRSAVSIIDAAKDSRVSVTVGAGPDALAVNTRTGRVYVVNSSDGTVTVLDGKNDKVLATVHSGAHPYVLAVNESTNRIYVTNTFSDAVAVIDGDTNAVNMMKIGSADNVVVDQRSNRVFFIGYEDPNLRILNGADNSLERAHLGEHLWGMAVNEVTGVVYVTRAGNAEVVALDKDLRTKTAISVGAIPCALAVNPKANRIYVANYGDDTVTAIDGGKHKAVATVRVGHGPQAIAVDIKANLIYAANTHADSLTVIDGKRYAPIATLPGGKNPFAIAVEPNTGKPYVANFGQPSLTAMHLRPAAKPLVSRH
jgi:YVTN family beta-propeller protein